MATALHSLQPRLQPPHPSLSCINQSGSSISCISHSEPSLSCSWRIQLRHRGCLQSTFSTAQQRILRASQTLTGCLPLPEPVSGTRSRSGVRAVSQEPGTEPSQIEYKFSDEASHAEVRITVQPELLPPKKSKSKVFVNTTADSLTVTLSHSGAKHQLLNVRPLFSTVSPKETTWHWDEDELVVLLQKDKAVPWSGLLQNWASLCSSLAVSLKSCSVCIAGTCSPRVKWDVAQELGLGLGYTPLASDLLLAQITGSAVAALVEAEGPESVAKAEADILQSISTNVRVVVSSMCPFPVAPEGVMSRSSTDARWRYLFGGLLVWIDLKDAPEAAGALEQPVDAAIRVGVGEAEWGPEAARATAEGVVKALRAVLDADDQLPGKKGLYVRMGCRGDWPDLMPPGWAPGGGVP